MRVYVRGAGREHARTKARVEAAGGNWHGCRANGGERERERERGRGRGSEGGQNGGVRKGIFASGPE
jgi:hypothetical protein